MKQLAAIISLGLFLFVVLSFNQITQETVILKEDAQKSFEYLNQVRANPPAFSKKIKINLNAVKPSSALIWDTTLAKVAEQKAIDMASKNYFAHVDKKGYGMNYYVHKAGYKLHEGWLKNKKDNFVESIGANTEGADGLIDQLIIDDGVPNLGHRKHLLSMTEFYTKNTRIGIGIAYNPKSEFGYYCSIVIAPEPVN